MELNKNQVMALMDAPLTENLSITNANVSHATTDAGVANCFYDAPTAWNYWERYYYPTVIRESYPIYIQERALDKGKQAFEIIKVLKDKKLVNLSKVSDFIDLMDELIKIL